MASISFKDEGIARAIKEGNLFVPPNQREYAWEQKHVTDLYEDIADAMAKGASEYFLGSIVVAKHHKGGSAVYDGNKGSRQPPFSLRPSGTITQPTGIPREPASLNLRTLPGRRSRHWRSYQNSN